MIEPRRLLWIDALSGLVAGVLTVSLAWWLSDLYRIQLSLMLVIGCANLVYGIYALTLARRRTRPLWSVLALAGANATWTVVCFGVAFALRDSASAFGLAHLVFEGVYVGVLAGLEWRFRGDVSSTA